MIPWRCVRRGRESTAELTEQVGVTRQTIIALEACKYTPSLALAFRLARAFGCTVEDVFQFAGGPPETGR
jgi:putative transcriptional regulator